MTTSEKFSVRWNDFKENISSDFSNLRDDTNFTDVTLISEDGQNIETHKVILSASSPFFMNILKNNKHSHPLIYLKGFKAKDIYSLLDFVYYGVADVYQENLEGFLALAEELQLKGLTGGTEEKQEQKKEVRKESIQNKAQLKLSETYDSYTNNEVEPNCEGENDIKDLSTVVALNNSAAAVYFNGGTAEDLKSKLWSMIEQNGTVLTCTVCGKSNDKTLEKNAKAHMMSHVESLHTEGVLYECNKCDKTFRSKNALHKHTQQIHNRH